MNTYDVSVSIRRQKVAVIKLIRAVSGMGLKDCKDMVEKRIEFHDHMSPRVSLKLLLDEAGLGRLAHFCTNRDSTDITSAEVVHFNRVDFDFTK